MLRVLVLALLSGMFAGSALAGDRELLAAIESGLGRTAAASRAGASGEPGRVQVHYDRARDLAEHVRAAAPFSAACQALGGWVERYARAEVASAEAFDRLDPAGARRFRAVAGAARLRLIGARRSCRPARARGVAEPPALIEPRPGAVTFGEVVARAPAGADAATLYANGVLAGSMAIADGIARVNVQGRSGRYDLEARFARAGTPLGVARSPGIWMLPATAARPAREATEDPAWRDQVRQAATRFSGIAGVWMHDLATGRAASWNAGAAFPAASTVKLGAIVEALRRMGPHPEASALAHDVAAIGGWSSNLAANRLLGRVGGAARVQLALRRMGATASTYTGPYIVATERPAVEVLRRPPRVSGRVTTAADLGTVMELVHDAAAGSSDALARTGMTLAQARLALGVLLASEGADDNLGLFREALGRDVPAAQKHGWISSARHSAAVVYTDRGPVVIVALTYKPGLTRAAAATLGAELVRIATAAQ